MLGLEELEPAELLRPAQLAFGRLGERGHLLRVDRAQALGLTRGLEALLRVLADRLQHGEPVAISAHEALVDERCQVVEMRGADLLGGLERPAAGKDGEPREQFTLALTKEVVTPLDRRPKRLLARREVAAPVRDERQALPQPGEDRGRAEHLHPRRREFDRKRKSVEPVADLAGDVRVPVQGEARSHRARSLQEQREGVVGAERRQRVLSLDPQVQGFPARDEHPQMRGSDKWLAQLGCRVEHLLEVVDDEQQRLVLERTSERAIQRLSPVLLHPERLRNRRNHERRIGDRGEGDVEDAVAELVDELRAHRQGEPGLSRPAGAGHGHEPDVRPAQQCSQFLELLAAPDQRRGCERQVRVVQALERREVVATKLEELLGLRQILETVLPQVAQHRRLVQERPRRSGDQHLASMAGRSDARRPVKVHADIPLGRQRRLAGVDAHAHAHPPGRERPLCFSGRRHGAAGRLEGDEEGIALGAELDAAVVVDRLAQYPVMLCEQDVVGGPELVQQPCRTLDVGEEECDGSGRKLAHGVQDRS